MLSERFGHFLDKPLTGLSLRIRLHPNTLTITGFFIILLSAFIIPLYPLYGGILLFAGALFDMLDGIVARNRNLVSTFGAFLDSTLDRLSDALIFLSLAILFYLRSDIDYSLLSILSLIFSFLVSYTRARIEGLGGEGKIGIAERPERLIILIAGLITGYIEIAIWIILITTIITTFHRGYHAWKIFKTTG